MVPLLVMFLDIKLVVPTSAVLGILSGFLLISTFHTWKWLKKKDILLLAIGGIIGSILGAYALASVKSDIIKSILGIFVAAYALKMLFWNTENTKKIKDYYGIIAGFFSGCLGGLFSTGGPPAIIYLKAKMTEKRAFRSTLILYLLITNTWQCAIYCYSSMISRDTLKFVLLLMPSFIIGNVLGSFLHIKINEILFSKIIALVLLATGISLLF